MSKKPFTPHYRVFTNNHDFVKVGCSYAGKMYYGVAKCAPEDTFNLVFGYRLAKARCDYAICTAKLRRSHDKLDLYRYYAEKFAAMVNDEEIYERKLHMDWMEAANELTAANVVF